MASSAKNLSFLFLLFLIFSLQIHARESQFFSKVTRDNNNNNNTNNKNTTTKESEKPSHTQDEGPNFTPQNHNGFGLYGHGTEQFSPNSVNDAYYTPTNFPKKTTTTTTELYTPENYEQNSFNYNGYENKQQGSMRDSRYVDTSYLNNNNNYYNENEMKQQGMSDTRFLENGKYFYDVNNEDVYHDRYHNQYESPKEIHNGYASSYRGVESKNRYNNYGGYNGNNNANTYEFTNSMDGFQNQNEEFLQNQEEFVP
ncbi:protein E6-like [Telopea speciosissima]|uniref:protein E6-like n=1 Tax=Telopea speciosissima TaxID=54955 RepID=UPI001CC4B8CB|nr:protein E6-like [Telopea speciosissima]